MNVKSLSVVVVVVLDDVPISTLLPSQVEILHLKQDFTVLWSRVLVKHFREFAFLKKAVVYHIPHECSQIMTEPVEEVCTIVVFVCTSLAKQVPAFFLSMKRK